MFVDNQEVSALQSLFNTVQREHLVTRQQVQDEFYCDMVDQAIAPEILDAVLSEHTAMTTKSASLDEMVRNGLISKLPAQDLDAIARAFPPLTDKEIQAHCEKLVESRALVPAPQPFEKVVVVLGDTPPPNARWGTDESIIEYLNIYKAVVTREPVIKLDKPDMTPEQIEAEIKAEEDSAIYAEITHKLRHRLVDSDKQLDLDVARRLNDAGFPVAYSSTLARLTVTITKDVVMSWSV